jgi:hypothetical protein
MVEAARDHWLIVVALVALGAGALMGWHGR